MNYIEFNPQKTLGANTNGVNLVYELLSKNDQSWLTQSNSSVCRWGCPGGNGYFAAVAAHVSEDDKRYLNDHEQALRKICAVIAEFVKKDYDVTFFRTVEREKTITVDVPKVRKVGFFKKEEYIDHETRTEKYSEQETVTYKGWEIERLVRKEDYGYGNPPDTLYISYCLGADGKLYIVASENNDNADPVVLECIFFSPAFLSNRFTNIYSAAISGVIGALDAIPMDQNDPLRNVHIKIDSDYYYNFPLQIDDGHSYSYGFLDGVIKRLVCLLDESSKKECYKKYDWMGKYLYPETKK